MRNPDRKLTVDFIVEGESEQREVYQYESTDVIPTQEEYLQDIKNFCQTDDVVITSFHIEEL